MAIGFSVQLATAGLSLEANTVFDSLNEAQIYAAAPGSYVGKLISVKTIDVNTNKTTVTVYVIEQDEEGNKVLQEFSGNVDTSDFVKKEDLATPFTYKGLVESEDTLPTDAVKGDMYYLSTEKVCVMFNGVTWDNLGDIGNYEELVSVESFEQFVGDYYTTVGPLKTTVDSVKSSLKNKVDAVKNHSLVDDNVIGYITDIYNDKYYQHIVNAFKKPVNGESTPVFSNIHTLIDSVSGGGADLKWVEVADSSNANTEQEPEQEPEV